MSDREIWETLLELITDPRRMHAFASVGEELAEKRADRRAMIFRMKNTFMQWAAREKAKGGKL
jgi:hypothetical protein